MESKDRESERRPHALRPQVRKGSGTSGRGRLRKGRSIRSIAAILLIACLSISVQALADEPKVSPYAGSASCRECHEKFYKLWSTSFHGLAMQPYTSDFARTKLTAHTKEIAIDGLTYRAEISGTTGYVVERGKSPSESKQYKIEHVLGGKNVYYFLTPMEKGRLQTLPLSYDVKKKEWFDTAASGVRHFSDQPVHWKESVYTFNTACYSCHVSQLSTNYDLKTDTYHTVWAEPGINCETCHGPSEEHNRVCREAPKGTVPADLKIISAKRFTADQHNATCSACHAKMIPLTATFTPGDKFFDHYDLITLENPDFYPDGRDLGENYTYTSWLMSPCLQSGKLHCVTCHTSSGRYRFKAEEKANDACMPCHAEKVNNAPVHTHHKAGSKGNQCVSCHMPMTSFARMNRTDHSMLPPAPAATIKYKSPNACNLCHTDRDAAWADSHVRKWRKRDYQSAVLLRAGLIEAARKGNWSRLPDILSYIKNTKNNEVHRTSLMRLLRACSDERKWSVLRQLLKDPSSLVRSSAALLLSDGLTRENIDALLPITADPVRLVRIRAAEALSPILKSRVPEEAKQRFEAAQAEFLSALNARPDDWSSHYNLGNFYASRNEIEKAIASYETALRLEPRALLPLTNIAIVYSQTGEYGKAEKSLRRAIEIDSKSAPVHFNLGLLLAERDRKQEAEKELRTALNLDPRLAPAAYNLGLLIIKERPDEGLSYCRKAHELSPNDPKYSYTLAFYQAQKGDRKGAIKTLRDTVKHHPGYIDAVLLLGQIYEKDGKKESAKEVYRKALSSGQLSERDSLRIKMKLQSLGEKEKGKKK
jgi:Tfp pilus assembly protein PilF